jgi:hypothetical protein
MVEKVFKWLDAHNLSQEEIRDFDYLVSLIINFEEEEGSLIRIRIKGLVEEYQSTRLKK